MTCVVIRVRHFLLYLAVMTQLSCGDLQIMPMVQKLICLQHTKELQLNSSVQPFQCQWDSIFPFRWMKRLYILCVFSFML